jgi:predicted sugar kinase
LLGGLIVNAGHLAGEPLGRLKSRDDIPAAWRFVLIAPPDATGRSGSDEERSMAELPPVPAADTAEMNELIDSQLVPAVQTADFAGFSRALYRYGCLAGKCFAPAQGGVFASTATAELIAWLRAQGIEGVGQSSWGPTVFALCENSHTVCEIESVLRSHPAYGRYSVLCAEPANSSATVL